MYDVYIELPAYRLMAGKHFGCHYTLHANIAVHINVTE